MKHEFSAFLTVFAQDGATAAGAAPVEGAATGAPAAAPIKIVGSPGTQGAPAGTGALSLTPGGTAAGAQAAPRTPGFFEGPFLLILLGFLAFMLITSFLGGRKERKARAAMLSGLSSNDRVQTTGGIIGTVVEVRAEEDMVVLRVDDASNTRIRFARGAVAHVLKKANAPAAQAEGKPAADGKPAKEKAGAA